MGFNEKSHFLQYILIIHEFKKYIHHNYKSTLSNELKIIFNKIYQSLSYNMCLKTYKHIKIINSLCYLREFNNKV